MNFFDNLQQAAQAIVAATFGYNATWIPSSGGELQTARVLFAQPTRKESVNAMDYVATRPRMEFMLPAFAGLLESVLANNTERVIINDIVYVAYTGEKKFDGKTIVIYLDTEV